MTFGIGALQDLPRTGVKIGDVNAEVIYLGTVRIWPPVKTGHDVGIEIFWEDATTAGPAIGWLLVQGGPVLEDVLLMMSGAGGYPAIEDQRTNVATFGSLTAAAGVGVAVPVRLAAGMTAAQVVAAIKTGWALVPSDNIPEDFIKTGGIPSMFLNRPPRGPTALPGLQAAVAAGGATLNEYASRVVVVYASDATGGTTSQRNAINWGDFKFYTRQGNTFQEAGAVIVQQPHTAAFSFRPQNLPPGATTNTATVHIVDQFGTAVVGEALTVTVVGNAVVTTANIVTDANGDASFTFQTGATAGTPAEVSVSSATVITGLPHTFSTPVVGAPATLTLVTAAALGDQHAGSNTIVRYEVKDAANRGVENALITLTFAGGGTATDVTDANGLLIYRWNLPTAVGATTLSASLGALTATQVTANIIAAGVTYTTIESGDSQTVVPGGQLADIVIKFEDVYHNPAAGIAVNRDGNPAGTTDANGKFTLHQLVGNTGLGRYTLRFEAGGVTHLVYYTVANPPAMGTAVYRDMNGGLAPDKDHLPQGATAGVEWSFTLNGQPMAAGTPVVITVTGAQTGGPWNQQLDAAGKAYAQQDLTHTGTVTFTAVAGGATSSIVFTVV